MQTVQVVTCMLDEAIWNPIEVKEMELVVAVDLSVNKRKGALIMSYVLST